MFNHFEGAEAFKAAPGQEKPEKEKHKSSLFKKVGILVSAAALWGAVENNPAFAAEKKAQPEINNREKIADTIKQNALTEKEILAMLETKGKKGMMNNTPIKMWTSPDGKTVIAGYDKQNKAKWILEENKDATMRMLDYNANGSVERVIINNEKKDKKIRSRDNDLNSFSSIDFLAKQAGITTGIQPEDVEVFSFIVENDKRIIRSVNFKDGRAYETDDPQDVQKTYEKAQKFFGFSLKSISTEMKK